MDAMSYRLERLIRETAYDLTAGTARANDVRETLMAQLDAIRPFVPRTETLRLEVLIDALCGVRK